MVLGRPHPRRARDSGPRDTALTETEIEGAEITIAKSLNAAPSPRFAHDG
jgi:hypothetical protein